MGCQQSLQCFRAHQRGIAWQHDGEFRVSHCAAGHLHGVSGAVLRLLQHHRCARAVDRCGDLFRLVPDHYDSFFWLQRRTRANHLLHQRSAAGAVQHFCEARFQAGAFTGGEYDYGKIFIWHEVPAQFAGAG